MKSKDGRDKKDGASGAWSTAYSATSRQMKRLSVAILRKAAVGMSDDHDDVAQTVFLKLLEIEQTGRPWVEHSAYLLAMARNANGYFGGPSVVIQSGNRVSFLSTFNDVTSAISTGFICRPF